MTIDEPAADLAIVSAVASSVRNRPLIDGHRRLRRGRPRRRDPRRPAGRRSAFAKPSRWGSRASSCRSPTSTASWLQPAQSRASRARRRAPRRRGARRVAGVIVPLEAFATRLTRLPTVGLTSLDLPLRQSTVPVVIPVSYRSVLHGVVHPGSPAFYGRSRVHGVSAPSRRCRSARQRRCSGSAWPASPCSSNGGCAISRSPACSARCSAAAIGLLHREGHRRGALLGRPRRSARRVPARLRPAAAAVPRAGASAGGRASGSSRRA